MGRPYETGFLYILVITQTNFLSWSYSASCHPYTLDAPSCLRMSERNLILFFISYLAEGTSLNRFGHTLVACLGYRSWDKLRISRGRRCYGRVEVHWSPDYQVWEDFPVVSCQDTGLFPGLTFSYLYPLSKFIEPSKLFTSTVILGHFQ